MHCSNHFSCFTKTLAVTLSLLIVLLGLPLSVFAEDLQNLFASEAGEAPFAAEESIGGSNAAILSLEPFEETSLRSDSTKAFRLPDGSHYLAQYTTDIHNLDADGNYRDIDNTLKLSAGVFSTEDGRFSLAEKTGDGKALLTRSFGNASLSFSVKNARSAAGTVEKNTVELPRLRHRPPDDASEHHVGGSV